MFTISRFLSLKKIRRAFRDSGPVLRPEAADDNENPGPEPIRGKIHRKISFVLTTGRLARRPNIPRGALQGAPREFVFYTGELLEYDF